MTAKYTNTANVPNAKAPMTPAVRSQPPADSHFMHSVAAGVAGSRYVRANTDCALGGAHVCPDGRASRYLTNAMNAEHARESGVRTVDAVHKSTALSLRRGWASRPHASAHEPGCSLSGREERSRLPERFSPGELRRTTQ